MVRILEISTTAEIGGTSAELLANDELSVEDLLYGMMLPSGNDAAQSLAIYFGNFI
jgi:D-alanyl-D-alanine carboxypeptidase (penicillin-binding protein 5/6)